MRNGEPSDVSQRNRFGRALERSALPRSADARRWLRTLGAIVKQLLRLAKLVWALPCTVVGFVFAGVALLVGGKATWSAGVLEVTYRERQVSCGRLARRLPFRGIVFGHVILAVTREELAIIGAHERVHVQQYERWGLLMFPAYGLSSLWQLIRGRSSYWNNYFEAQARALSDCAPRR